MNQRITEKPRKEEKDKDKARKGNMYFTVETFSGHPGLLPTCRLKETSWSSVMVCSLRDDGAYGRDYDAGNPPSNLQVGLSKLSSARREIPDI